MTGGIWRGLSDRLIKLAIDRGESDDVAVAGLQGQRELEVSRRHAGLAIEDLCAIVREISTELGVEVAPVAAPPRDATLAWYSGVPPAWWSSSGASGTVVCGFTSPVVLAAGGHRWAATVSSALARAAEPERVPESNATLQAARAVVEATQVVAETARDTLVRLRARHRAGDAGALEHLRALAGAPLLEAGSISAVMRAALGRAQAYGT